MYSSNLKYLLGSETVIRPHRRLDDRRQRVRTLSRSWCGYQLRGLAGGLSDQVADHLVRNEVANTQVPDNFANPNNTTITVTCLKENKKL